MTWRGIFFKYFFLFMCLGGLITMNIIYHQWEQFGEFHKVHNLFKFEDLKKNY